MKARCLLPWVLRVVTLCIFVLNIAILALSYTSLVLSSITPTMAALTVSNWLALVIIAGAEIYKLYQVCHSDWKQEHERTCYAWVFAIIGVDMLPSAVFYSVSERAATLCKAFAGVRHSCTFSTVLLVLAWLTPLISFAGFIFVLSARQRPPLRSMDSDYIGSPTPPCSPSPLPVRLPEKVYLGQDGSLLSITHSMEMGHVTMPYFEGGWPTTWNPFIGHRTGYKENESRQWTEIPY